MSPSPTTISDEPLTSAGRLFINTDSNDYGGKSNWTSTAIGEENSKGNNESPNIIAPEPTVDNNRKQRRGEKLNVRGGRGVRVSMVVSVLVIEGVRVWVSGVRVWVSVRESGMEGVGEGGSRRWRESVMERIGEGGSRRWRATEMELLVRGGERG
ncbi:hypothetical protein ACFE04_002417 [Oxalis oulophora]